MRPTRTIFFPCGCNLPVVEASAAPDAEPEAFWREEDADEDAVPELEELDDELDDPGGVPEPSAARTELDEELLDEELDEGLDDPGGPREPAAARTELNEELLLDEELDAAAPPARREAELLELAGGSPNTSLSDFSQPFPIPSNVRLNKSEDAKS